MKVSEARLDSAVNAYDWVRYRSSGTVGHAVVEQFNGNVIRTLCGHVRQGNRGAEVTQRCGTCLNVIYAKLGVKPIGR